jgi:hypothetical protein
MTETSALSRLHYPHFPFISGLQMLQYEALCDHGLAIEVRPDQQKSFGPKSRRTTSHALPVQHLSLSIEVLR